MLHVVDSPGPPVPCATTTRLKGLPLLLYWSCVLHCNREYLLPVAFVLQAQGADQVGTGCTSPIAFEGHLGVGHAQARTAGGILGCRGLVDEFANPNRPADRF